MSDNLELDRFLPLNNPFLIGHLDVENEFLNSLEAGQLHNSWLLVGEKGIGKATFAYRVVKYLFSLKKNNVPGILDLNSGIMETSLDFDNIEDDSDSLFEFDDVDDSEVSESVESSVNSVSNNFDNQLDKLDSSKLKLPINHPVFEKLAVGGIADFVLIKREALETNPSKLKSEISVEQIRKLKEFFSKTSMEGGYRVAIIDAVDDMNINSSNALLKLLEEPPKKSLLLLVCHNQNNVLDTIKSRCRILKFNPISDDNLQILIKKYIPNVLDDEIKILSSICPGSIGNILNFYNNSGIDIFVLFYKVVLDVLSNRNVNLFELSDLISVDENKFDVFKKVFINFVENLIKFSVSKEFISISENSNKVIELVSSNISNIENLFKFRDEILNDFYLVKPLNLDYFAVIVTVFERLKNACR